jgi:predicted esterase
MSGSNAQEGGAKLNGDSRTSEVSDPHAGQPVRVVGEPLEQARAALVMLHGRGASAEDILGLARELAFPGLTYLAPQAAGHQWYPYSFLAPIDQNEPDLSSALAAVGSVVTKIEQAGIPTERIAILGFSQGACLALEFAARHARRYGGVIGFTGGLIGPDGTPRDYSGAVDSTPIFIGGSDVDPHVPLPRMEESAHVLERMGAKVDLRIYPGMGHTVNADEIAAARAILMAVTTEDA